MDTSRRFVPSLTRSQDGARAVGQTAYSRPVGGRRRNAAGGGLWSSGCTRRTNGDRRGQGRGSRLWRASATIHRVYAMRPARGRRRPCRPHRKRSIRYQGDHRRRWKLFRSSAGRKLHDCGDACGISGRRCGFPGGPGGFRAARGGRLPAHSADPLAIRPGHITLSLAPCPWRLGRGWGKVSRYVRPAFVFSLG
jgi:hypothetical protein